MSKKAATTYPMPVTIEELGVIVIALNSLTPTDHRAEFVVLRDRLTLAWATRRPDAYERGISNGEIQPHRKHREEIALAALSEEEMEI